MNPRAIAVTLLFCVTPSAAAQEVLQVVKVRSDQPNTFDFGDKCTFETSLPDIPVRLRIIRGSRSDLVAYGTTPANVRSGCIEYYSAIIRPFRDTDDPELLDLGFFLTEGWVARDGGPGRWMFVVERDPEQIGPRYRRDVLRLPAGTAAIYFASGIEVTVLPSRSISLDSSPGVGRDELLSVQPCVELRIDPRPPATMQAAAPDMVPRPQIVPGSK